MSTIAHVGTSHHVDSTAAGTDAARAAREGLGGRQAAVALVFASADHDHGPLLAAIQRELPGVPLVGCTGEGVIADDQSNETLAATAVMAIASDRVRFETCLIDDYGRDPVAAAAALAARVNSAGPEVRCLCVMPDGLHGNCTDLLRALHDRIEVPMPIIGGAAADAMTFDTTWQYGEGRVVTGGLAALMISGPVDDGQPAWRLFKDYLGDDAADLNAEGIVHLCIGERLLHHAADYDPLVIRTPLQLDQSSGSLFFPGGGLTEGRTIQFTRRDPEKIRASVRDTAARLRDSHPDRAPDVVFQFDCAGRGRILWGGGASAEVVAPLRQALGAATPWIGFHTYGEIAPIAGMPYYHNYSVALCALYERGAA
jgi:hypothetical protein